MPNPSDRQLNAFLGDLTQRLASTAGERIEVGLEDLPDEDETLIEPFVKAGFLRPAEPAKAVICDGCERCCVMPVQIVGRTAQTTRSVVVCDKRDDIGPVPVSMGRLRRWSASGHDVALILSRLLGGVREPVKIAPNAFWDLGEIRLGKVEAEVLLAPNAEAAALGTKLAIVLAEPDQRTAGPCVGLSWVLSFRDAILAIHREALRHVLANRMDDPRVAWEIKFEGGDILLVNHVVDQTRTIATPHFNSSNDNAFQVLYDNPDKSFSLKELRLEAREPALADLHKIVENLNFDGQLKKLFFRVSRNAIRFNRVVTMGQLATLGIDPKSIS